MRVSLASKPDPALAGERATAGPLLAAGGSRVILGPRQPADDLAVSVVPGPTTLFGPRGAVINAATGALAVADTGHHRLLIWHKTPSTDHAPADLQIGQADFASEGRNGRGPVSAATLNVPTGVATDGQRLAVADAWNHRILIWNTWPERANQPADVVLGQADFSSSNANRGGEPGATTLNWCYGVSCLRGRFAVAEPPPSPQRSFVTHRSVAMPDVKLTPEESAELEAKREDHHTQQPYASELDDRELEHAHKDKRPVDPEAGKPGKA